MRELVEPSPPSNPILLESNTMTLKMLKRLALVLFALALALQPADTAKAQWPTCPTCASPGGCECSPFKGLHAGRHRPRSGGPNLITGVDSAQCTPSGEPTWDSRGPLPWEMFAHGEYIGPHRLRHVGVYRLRVDDEVSFSFRLTRNINPFAYQLQPGDTIQIESMVEDTVLRTLDVQPDGTIVVPLGVGRVPAAGRTIDQLRHDLDTRFNSVLREPSVTVTPIKVNSRLEDLRAVVDSRQGSGGQFLQGVISPDGTVQLPALGSVPAHGLTLDELKREIDSRYSALLNTRGIEVTPALTKRAPKFIFVLGEVTKPGRFELNGPTNVMQAIALAEGWNNGANLRNIVVFRRAEDWRLMATKIDIQGSLYGKRPIPTDNIWLRDSDVILVSKTPLKVVDDAIDLIFTQGIYAAFPPLTDGFFFQDQTSI